MVEETRIKKTGNGGEWKGAKVVVSNKPIKNGRNKLRVQRYKRQECG